jgi:hypothetical protein
MVSKDDVLLDGWVGQTVWRTPSSPYAVPDEWLIVRVGDDTKNARRRHPRLPPAIAATGPTHRDGWMTRRATSHQSSSSSAGSSAR